MTHIIHRILTEMDDVRRDSRGGPDRVSLCVEEHVFEAGLRLIVCAWVWWMWWR